MIGSCSVHSVYCTFSAINQGRQHFPSFAKSSLRFKTFPSIRKCLFPPFCKLHAPFLRQVRKRAIGLTDKQKPAHSSLPPHLMLPDHPEMAARAAWHSALPGAVSCLCFIYLCFCHFCSHLPQDTPKHVLTHASHLQNLLPRYASL